MRRSCTHTRPVEAQSNVAFEAVGALLQCQEVRGQGVFGTMRRGPAVRDDERPGRLAGGPDTDHPAAGGG